MHRILAPEQFSQRLFFRQNDLIQLVSRVRLGLVASGDNRVYDAGKCLGVPVSACLPPLAHTVVSKEVPHCSLNLIPQLGTKYPFAAGVVHSFKVLEETILERAKSELGDGIQIVERMHTAKKKRSELCVFVQCLCQIAPLNRESIHRRLAAFSGLLADLDREVNERRNSDTDRGQLPDRCDHLPVHVLLRASFARRDAERFLNRRRVVHFSAFDHGRDFVDVPNVLRRVAIHENHVSQFPRRNDAAIFVHTHY